jgi:hypothetical protein
MASASANTQQPTSLSSRFRPEPQGFSVWWHGSAVQRRLPDLIVILGVIATFTILWAFYQVVSSSVDRGELRRQTMALHAEAVWHCSTLSHRGAGESCLRQVSSSVDVSQASN